MRRGKNPRIRNAGQIYFPFARRRAHRRAPLHRIEEGAACGAPTRIGLNPPRAYRDTPLHRIEDGDRHARKASQSPQPAP